MEGHVVRMDKNRTTKKDFSVQPIGTRRKARQNLRWINGLEKDLLILRTKNWRTLAGKGWPGKGFLRRPRLTLGSQTTEEGRICLNIQTLCMKLRILSKWDELTTSENNNLARSCHFMGTIPIKYSKTSFIRINWYRTPFG
ncbi:uncharacterized protein TNCV_1242041 [Trichonephila clavipes]|nr:uncharacterized protein TNCV_1242041 [Trichonephila clavipes]